jgi:hypothetical protein
MIGALSFWSIKPILRPAMHECAALPTSYKSFASSALAFESLPRQDLR